MQVEEYLISKQVEYKFSSSRKDIQIKRCPFCSNENYKLYITADTGVFHCFVCDEPGGLYKLRLAYGDAPITKSSFLRQTFKKLDQELLPKSVARLQQSEVALKYLKSRKITPEATEHFTLGLSENGELCYPAIKHGQLVNIKHRSIQGEKKMFRIKDCESALFNGDILYDNPEKVYVTEGEIDCVSLWQYGMKNVVGNTLGAGSWNNDWTELFYSVGQIFILYDNDDAGQKGARKLAEILGVGKCLIVNLPENDINQCLVRGCEAVEIFSDISTVVRDSIKTISDYFTELKDRLADDEFMSAYSTPFGQLNNLVKFRKGELVVLTGDTSTGKTTFATFLSYYWTILGYPVFMASFEMEPIDILEKLIEMESRKSLYQRELSDTELEEAAQVLGSIYFLEKYGFVDDNELFDNLEFAKKKYGVKIVILDSLQFFTKKDSGNEAMEIERVMVRLGDMCKRLGMLIILVVHPKQDLKQGETLKLHHLKGSSSIKQVAFTIISLTRSPDSTDVAVTVMKNRKHGTLGTVTLGYNPHHSFYRQSGEQEMFNTIREAIDDN